MHANLRPSVRPGSVTPFVVVTLSVLLAALALAINPAWLWSNRAELQAGADAVSIAAAETLVDDDLLRGDPNQIAALLARSTAEAVRFANLNVVRGRPFPLLVPDDVRFGALTAPRGQFTPIPDVTNTADPSLPQVNAVQVTGRLTAARGNAVGLLFSAFSGFSSADVLAQATTILDQAVVGFRPLPDHPVLLAPLALLSDVNPLDLRSWESQVENKKGTDNYTFDRQNHVFVQGQGDGLYEFTAALAIDTAQLPAANVAILHLGVNTQAGVNQQIRDGVTADQLPGGQLLLPPGGPLTVAGKLVGPGFNSADLNALIATLNQLRAAAEPRIWPLYTGAGAGTVQVSGFVVARVVVVIPPPDADAPLLFTLQPTMVAATATTLTEPARPVRNRYVCKVRVVQ